MAEQYPQLVVSDGQGRIVNVPFLQAVGMAGGQYVPLTREDCVRLPACSALYMLPDRLAIACDLENRRLCRIDTSPLEGISGPVYPVAAFLAPGYTASYHAAFEERPSARLLPMFAYGAVAFFRGEFYAAAIRVDRELRQDPRLMDLDLMKQTIREYQKRFPENRLMRHLETCACVNGCPAARNFFLKRYEAPLPTSPTCNARCVGCISYQPDGECPVTQPRIAFVPTPEEVAETALTHIRATRDPVVSFGQGCEGEPLNVADILIESVRLIRRATRRGVINLNTNASRPEAIRALFEAGLDSVRVSLNSLQPEYYERYYRPKGYSFADVMASIRIAKRCRGFVSINYLVAPGVTDSAGETRALRRLLRTGSVDMIQWRNMNFDPLGYLRAIGFESGRRLPLGLAEHIRMVHREFPATLCGYFNPSRSRRRRFFRRLGIA